MLLKRLYCKPLLGALLATATVAVPVGAYAAANDAMLQLLKVLKDKGTIDQATYDSLVAAAKADDEHVAFAEDEVKRQQKETPKVETNGKLKVTSADKDFEWQLIGRLHADYDAIDSDKNKIGSGAELRRARLGMQGKMWQHWLYKFEWDFPSSQAKDAFVGYAQDNWWLKVGQQNLPFGLVTMSSDNYTLFVERPLLGEKLQDEYDMGVSAFIHGNNLWTLQAGVFAGPWDGNANAKGSTFSSCTTSDKGNFGCSEQINSVARGTINPYIRDPSHLLHLGGAVWYRNPEESLITPNAKFGRFNLSPTVLDTSPFFTASETIPDGCKAVAGGPTCPNKASRNLIDNIVAFNAEGLAVWGPFHVQGEYTHWNVDRNNSLPTADIDGYYVEAGYFLTDDSMNFKPGDGLMAGVQPRGVVGKGGWGAWQLAVRYDVLDLNDVKAKVIGGEERAVSGGVNWYVNNNMRFMADYLQVLKLDTIEGKLKNSKTSIFDGDHPSAFVMRAQVFW